MFTGIIEQRAKVESLTLGADAMARLMISPEEPEALHTALGDSIAINGVCLTVVAFDGKQWAFDVSRETLKKTTLGRLKPGREVNLEQALRMGDRLGGHLVSGHVDGIGTVKAWDKSPSGNGLKIHLPKVLGRYAVLKGSICLDGVSLTINGVSDHEEGTDIELMLVPLTMDRTIFRHILVGDYVNVEVDLLARYLERLALTKP